MKFELVCTNASKDKETNFFVEHPIFQIVEFP